MNSHFIKIIAWIVTVLMGLYAIITLISCLSFVGAPASFFTLIVTAIAVGFAIIPWHLMAKYLENQEHIINELNFIRSNIAFSNQTFENGTKPDLSSVPTGRTVTGNAWVCKKCGKENSSSSIHCSDCGEYK